ncbi:MAG: hypothetical protein [Myoviridae sp. ctThM1]|nr:MAG: hypothetical protein [Myoviridae sp. ctThM1]
MSKEIEVVIVSYEEYTSYEFVDPGTYFSVSAMQEYYFYKTSSREKAQAKCDELFGPGRYVVKTSKIIKTKSKLESGLQSVYATETKRGQRR